MNRTRAIEILKHVRGTYHMRASLKERYHYLDDAQKFDDIALALSIALEALETPETKPEVEPPLPRRKVWPNSTLCEHGYCTAHSDPCLGPAAMYDVCEHGVREYHVYVCPGPSK